MGTLTATAVVTRVATLLQDKDNIRWPLTELFLWITDAQGVWITDAQGEIGSYKPDALVKTSTLTLAAGTKQTLPSDGITLIDVVRNMGAGGLTPGRAPRLVMREILDAQLPTWHSDTASAEVKHYVFDPANQRAFYVQPPQPASGMGSLEIVYSAAPTPITAGTDVLALDDTWVSAVQTRTSQWPTTKHSSARCQADPTRKPCSTRTVTPRSSTPVCVSRVIPTRWQAVSNHTRKESP